MSTATTASPVPLFDRLAGAPRAADGRLLDGGGLQDSLRLDLARLFNVRNGLTVADYLAGEPTVLDYGLPDTLGLSPQSDQDLATWAAVLRHCLARFEARLTQVRVEVRADPARAQGARAAISAAVLLGQQLCRVDFDVALEAGSAEPRAGA